jgi:tRNA threonylcarbamoyladenosine biosynthesis protein TsaB
MNILCLDTSTDACTVALALGDGLLARRSETPRMHARLLLSMIDELLQEGSVALADLDAIAVGRGPGSFTGVRIGCSVAQGLAFGADLPVVPLSSLAILAAKYVAPAPDRDTGPADVVLVAQDARMQELYWAAFRHAGGAAALLDPVVHDRLDAPDGIAPVLRAASAGSILTGVGTAFAGIPVPGLAHTLGVNKVDATALPAAQDAIPMARELLRRHGGLPPEQVLPVYFRSPV